DAEAVLDVRDLVMADVDAAPGAAGAANGVEGRLAIRVAEEDGERGRVSLVHAVVVDVALLLEDLGEILLELREGHLGAIETRHGGVPESREHVGDGVRNHCTVSYQLDFVTPGSSPASARL